MELCMFQYHPHSFVQWNTYFRIFVLFAVRMFMIRMLKKPRIPQSAARDEDTVCTGYLQSFRHLLRLVNVAIGKYWNTSNSFCFGNPRPVAFTAVSLSF